MEKDRNWIDTRPMAILGDMRPCQEGLLGRLGRRAEGIEYRQRQDA
jgi:hypothetical protein